MPIRRVLQVVGRMDRAGTETWLMHVLRHIDREQFRMDFLVHTVERCAYDDEIHGLGGEVISCLHPSRPRAYARNFKRILREHGPYDVVHSHVHHYSGYVLRLADQAGVPIRIAHSHSDTSALQVKAPPLRRGYLALSKFWIARHATVGLAASRSAAAALFGSAWEDDPRWRVLFCGIDPDPFRAPADAPAVRTELGIPPDAFVLGHVGRFTEQKNQAFAVDIAAEVTKHEPRAYLLLVGDGPLRTTIEQRAMHAGLAGRVVFAGTRPDVPRLMLGSMDVFVFPSVLEGLGLVLIEAQAAGLPCVISDVVPGEADVVGPLVRRLSLSARASVWAEAVLDARETGRTVARPQCLTVVEQSPFNIRVGVRELRSLYSPGGFVRARIARTTGTV